MNPPSADFSIFHRPPRGTGGGRVRGSLGSLLFLALLGCEIERISPPSDQSSAQPTPATERSAPAPTTLSQALSEGEKPTSKAAAPQAQPSAPEESPDTPASGSTQTPPLGVTLGPPLSELDGWLAEQRQSSPGAQALAEGTFFVYGGGSEVDHLALPESLPEGSMETVSAFVSALEKSPETNAGVGASLRLDGSVELEAIVGDQRGTIGTALGVHGFAHPVLLAAALAQAGGAELRDHAATRLASKLRVERLPPVSDASRDQYLLDLSGYLAAGETKPGLALFHLLVDPEVTAKALSSGGRRNAPPARDPVFAVLVTSAGVSFAASYGGVPLSLPGASSVLESGRSFWSSGSRFAFVSDVEGCPRTARELLTIKAPTAQLARTLERDCPSRRYAFVEGEHITTNLGPSTYRSHVRGAQPGASGHSDPIQAGVPGPSQKPAETPPPAPPPKLPEPSRKPAPEAAPPPPGSRGEAKPQVPSATPESALAP